MQSIERYGVVALLFLVVTVVAVLVWDGGGEPDPTVKAADRGAAAAAEKPRGKRRNQNRRPEEPAAGMVPAEDQVAQAATGRPEDTSRIELHLAPSARPLTRDRVDDRDQVVQLDPQRNAGMRPADSTRRDDSPPAIPWDDRARTQEQPRSQWSTAEPRQRVASGGAGTYTVAPGDTLSEIAQRELGTYKRWREIVDANPGLDPAKISVGQVLRLPGATAQIQQPAPEPRVAAPEPQRQVERPRSQPAAARPSAPATGNSVRVASGDSLWKIAARTLGDGERWREIAALNPGLNPDKLFVGQEIVVPAGASTRTQPVVASNSRSSRTDSGSGSRGKVR